MDTFGCYGDIRIIEEELQRETLVQIKDGSGSSHFDGPSGWIHGLGIKRISGFAYPETGAEIARLQVKMIDKYGLITQVMVNRLEPGGRLDPHKDGLPNRARFHLPVVTNDDTYWWDEINGRIHMERDLWYGPVPYCGILHSAVNGGDTERIHLVVDFERGV